MTTAEGGSGAIEAAPDRPAGKGQRRRTLPRLGIRPHRFLPDADGDCSQCALLAGNRVHQVDAPSSELDARILGERPDPEAGAARIGLVVMVAVLVGVAMWTGLGAAVAHWWGQR
jgi:hypothetical protein